MKRIFKLLILAAVIAAIVYFLRSRLVPAPEPPVTEPPRFRVAPHEPAHDAPEPADPVPARATDAEVEADAETDTAAEADTAATPAGSGDDLTEINGIGPVFAMRLEDHGITTFAQIAAADADGLAALVDARPDQTAHWIEEAGGRV